MNKIIITAALIGAQATRQQNPHIPITPEEIADSAIEAYEAGAAIGHVHVRDLETGINSNDPVLFTRVVERIRSKCDMIINLSTSHGSGMYIPPEGVVLPENYIIQSPEERVAHVQKLKPELCSLDIGSMNFGELIAVNAPGVVEKMAELINEIGTKPEIELFDIGHIEIFHRLNKLGLIEGTPYFQLCMGTVAGIAGNPSHAVHFAESLPRNCIWGIFGVGPAEFPMVAMGTLMGGHVRVGFEDNLYLEKGVLAKSNAELVERAVAIIRNLNKEVANTDEAREILGLRK
jgi:uncharacterized protein (DUF849 family)